LSSMPAGPSFLYPIGFTAAEVRCA
jgi:hypothetical protein